MAEKISFDSGVLAWLHRHRELIDDLMRAESWVQHGTIQITFHDGQYVGMDAMLRKRLTNKKNKGMVRS